MESLKRTKEENVELVMDLFHRTIMHHAMWYGEVIHQYGREKALEIMNKVYTQSYENQMKRLAKTFDFELVNHQPAFLLNLSDDALQKVMESASVNWLANDGIWFQAIESSLGMFDAKRCNDSCWSQFSPFEAWSVRRLLKLSDKPGLEGLKKALNYRLYAIINKQSVCDETENSFVFQMNDCRVQNARKRKDMDDYPCKSAGIIEYRAFAEAIDSRIKTECVGAPPDQHPAEWFCAWKFSIK